MVVLLLFEFLFFFKSSMNAEESEACAVLHAFSYSRE